MYDDFTWTLNGFWSPRDLFTLGGYEVRACRSPFESPELLAMGTAFAPPGCSSQDALKCAAPTLEERMAFCVSRWGYRQKLL